VKPDARAARERKQKIFVVVGGIFLLAMLAFQLPRLLGGSGEAASATTSTPGTEQPAAPGATSPVVLVGAGGRTPALPGKVVALGAFERKNPFVQLVTVGDAVTTDAAPAKGSGQTSDARGDAPKGFSVGEKAAVPAVTIVSVNGARQTLQPGSRFPSSDPVFVLVSEQPKAKTVVVGVVGGAYEGGSKTAKLRVGKPLTLVNTATGATYEVTLVSVGSGDAPEQPASSK
jgi:hypothetical protein